MRLQTNTAVSDGQSASHTEGQLVAEGVYGAEAIEAACRWVCPTEDLRRDLVRAMLRDFVVGCEVRATLPAGPRLFASNHQVASDVGYFAALMSGLSRQLCDIVTWDAHYDLDSSQINRALYTYPDGPERTVATTLRQRMVNQQEPRDMVGVARAIGRRLSEEDHSFACVCVHGETDRHEGQEMRGIGAPFLDLALENDIPITPARFNWGLPDENEGRLMWSKNLAPLYFVTGAAIEPSDLSGLSRVAQRNMVAEAINALAVPRPESHFDDARTREDRVRWLATNAGMGLTKAILCDGLFTTPPEMLTDEGRKFLHLASIPGAGDAERAGGFFYRLCRWLSDGFGSSRIPTLTKVYPHLQSVA
ncbi:hypothetical protein RDV64_14095 [Acuticoccus sp. MNP-M23]|uniref:hypothetical protein n=1 Tax=Acuticoccus sp. MNP-M23 TaxID=3072793 RepID=UPI002815649E|nr:hypothetical protein [Acuticoccus sp. MNP-M23]WMS41210.1 hypothetical protein RDV64_14095 [Acuticoccus sp. MNP-M23]